MTPTILVALIVAAPAVLLTVLRVNAVLVFLSLCLGQVLVQFVGPEAMDTVGILALGTGKTSPQIVSLALLLLPPIFTVLITMHTVKKHLRLALNVLPALSIGVLLLLLTEPFFSPGLKGAIEGDRIWVWVQGLQPLAVGLSAIVSILFLWLHKPKKVKEEEHGHGGRHK